jgi:hypothetical protein
LIQLPYYVQNPVELLIADHATHFSGSSLQGLLERCGWVPCTITSDWIPKELSCVAELRSEKTSPPPRPVAEEDVRLPEDAVAWIEAFRTKARAAAAGARANGRAFGIFGTAIAGVWLSGELRDSAQFFVDEDPARVGRLLHGIPVVAPGAIPAHATVFMGVSAVIAGRIARRIQRDDLDLVSPPPNPC